MPILHEDTGFQQWHIDLEQGSSSEDSNYDLKRSSSHFGTEIIGVFDKGRRYSALKCSVKVDLVGGIPEAELRLDKVERDCKICHSRFDATNQEYRLPIKLGCSCKYDLAAPLKQCTEAWFKYKGNKTCEICGFLARNVDELKPN